MSLSHSRTQRFEALDGWRGIAALVVVFYQAPIVLPPRDYDGWPKLELAVDLFFVLSGFVMMHAWGQQMLAGQDIGKFIQRRFWRIYPLHFVVLAIMVALELAKLVMTNFVAFPMDAAPFTETKSLPFLLSNLLLTQSLGFHGPSSWNDPSWSISVEFWTYIILALVAFAARRYTLIVMSVIGVLALAGLISLSPSLISTYDYGFLRSLVNFSMGLLTYRAWTLRREGAPYGSFVEMAVVGLGLTYFYIAEKNGLMIWFAPLVFACLIYVFAQSNGIITRFLESRPIQALGIWSYSIYLFQAVVYYLAGVFVQALIKFTQLPLIWSSDKEIRTFSTGSLGMDLLIEAGLVVVLLLVSSLSYRWIERPGMAFGARLGAGAKLKASAASA